MVIWDRSEIFRVCASCRVLWVSPPTASVLFLLFVNLAGQNILGLGDWWGLRLATEMCCMPSCNAGWRYQHDASGMFAWVLSIRRVLIAIPLVIFAIFREFWGCLLANPVLGLRSVTLSTWARFLDKWAENTYCNCLCCVWDDVHQADWFSYGLVDNLHTSCLHSHLEDFPSHTAPAGYDCPACPTDVSQIKICNRFLLSRIWKWLSS